MTLELECWGRFSNIHTCYCFSSGILCASHAHCSLSAMLTCPLLSLVYMKTMPLDILGDIFYFA